MPQTDWKPGPPPLDKAVDYDYAAVVQLLLRTITIEVAANYHIPDPPEAETNA